MRASELNCLNAIKDAFYERNNMHIEKCNNAFQEVKNIIFSATQTNDINKFPDFFSGDSIIEHFTITSSKETRKGSYYKIHEINGAKKTKKYFETTDKEFIGSHHTPNTMHTASTENIYNSFTYADFVASFKKNFDNHYKSLIKSNYSNQKVVFLIEQDGARLCIYEKGSFNRFYLLSEDKQLLQYLRDKYPAVNYVLMRESDCVEIIDLSQINKLIASSKEGLDVRGGRMVNTSIKLYLDF